jgi:hypothetical protein
MGKIELKFDRAYVMVYEGGNFFSQFFAIVPEIPSPKHREIQEFAKNCHISAMEINKMFVF